MSILTNTISTENIETQEQLIRLINGYSASIDLEWMRFEYPYQHDKTFIYAASFCTSSGESYVLHISDYANNEKDLIQDILYYFKQFPLTFGWYTTGRAIYKTVTADDDSNNKTKKPKGHDSDFFVLHQRCQLYNLESPFEIKPKYVCLKQDLKHIRHIDLNLPFDKAIIKADVFGGRYRTTKLVDVSQTLLNIGKYNDLDAGATNISGLALEEQIEYAKRDAELTIALAKYNNCLLLRIMFEIAKYSRMNFFLAVHMNLSHWFSNLYKDMIKKGECTIANVPACKLVKEEVAGGHHSQPLKGFYIGIIIYELDVQGQYPNIVRNGNYSFDTVCCYCCRFNPNAWVSQELKDVINEELAKKGIERRVDDSNLWVCQRFRGAFPIIIERFLADRDYYKKLLKEEKSKPRPNKQLIEEYEARQITAKILCNAGAGLFAEKHFDFANYKVNELITGEGRRIHKKMEEIGQKPPYNFKVMFGFTDSVFFSNANDELINQFVKQFKDEMDVTIEIKNKYVNSIFYDEKNRSVTWTGNPNENPVIKGLNGDSDFDCQWVKKWFEKIIFQIVREPDNRFKTIPAMLQEAYADFEHTKQFNVKDLRFTEVVGQEVDEYQNQNARTCRLTKLLGKQKGDLVYHYKCNPEDTQSNSKTRSKTTAGYTIEPERANGYWYQKYLLDKLEKTLVITGFNFNSLVAAISQKQTEKENGMTTITL